MPVRAFFLARLAGTLGKKELEMRAKKLAMVAILSTTAVVGCAGIQDEQNRSRYRFINAPEACLEQPWITEACASFVEWQT